MEDRVDFHYAGGDIGLYLEQFIWSDDAIVLAWNRFEPFIRFFDALRAAAENQSLSSHTPITNPDIPFIFHEAFPGEHQFGDVQESPLTIDALFHAIDKFRGRAPTAKEG